MMIDEARNMLEQAIAGEPVNTPLLEQLSIYVASTPAAVPRAAQEIIPLLVQVIRLRQTIDEIPDSIFPNLLGDLPLASVFQVIPSDAFIEGFNNPTLGDKLIQILQRVQSSDLAGPAGDLCHYALKLLARPDLEAGLGSITGLAARLAALGVLAQYVPFADLYNGDAQVRTRLMTLNTFMVHDDLEFPLEYLLWPLDTDDILSMASYLTYLKEVLDESPEAKVTFYAHKMGPLLETITKMYVTGEEPLIHGSIEDVLVSLARRVPDVFATLDKNFQIIRRTTINLIARIPTAYLYAAHADLIHDLSLNSTTVSAFANLSTDPTTYKLLTMSATKIANLPMDLRVGLVAAATKDAETARLFAGTFSTIMDEILIPSTLPAIAELQNRIELNMRLHGLYVPKPSPQVATAHDS